jgi:hypothetical protein
MLCPSRQKDVKRGQILFGDPSTQSLAEKTFTVSSSPRARANREEARNADAPGSWAPCTTKVFSRFWLVVCKTT